MARKIERPTPGPPSPVSSVEQQTPSSSPRRPSVTNVTLLGQQLAQAFGMAQALIDRIPKDRDVTIEELRRWYYRQHPVEPDRVLWQRFTEAGTRTRAWHLRLGSRGRRSTANGRRSSRLKPSASCSLPSVSRRRSRRKLPIAGPTPSEATS
jgi:hypothetical protein